MLANKETIRTYFAKLGLNPEIADIYLSLYSNGPQAISELSRSSGVERTRIYRLIGQLLESNLIEMETKGARGIIKAAPVGNLRRRIIEREQETKNLADELELIEKVLSSNSLSNPAVSARIFEGPEGIRQMLERELQSKTEIICYLHPSVRETAGTKFMDEWQRRLQAEGLSRQALSNSPVPTNSNTVQRQVDPEKYLITHRTAVYGGIVAHYLLKDGKAYGIELLNKEIAGRERRLFEILWDQAEATR